MSFVGGAENANDMTFAMAEWLIAKGLTKKIVLTRLPVGHTHEDIDAIFGNLWTGMRNRNVFSPQEQTRIARQALKTVKVEWYDVFVVPGKYLYFFYLTYLRVSNCNPLCCVLFVL